jgi:putrescine transport system permease protein
VKRCDSELHEKVKRGVTPEINAVCTVSIAIVTIGVVIASVLQKRGLAVADR